MMIDMPQGGLWHQNQHGTTAPPFHFANQPPAIYRSADDPQPIINPLSMLEMQIKAPLPNMAPQQFGASKAFADERLDWDAALKLEPARPSGTFIAKFKDEGRDMPSPTRDPWD